MMEPKVIFLVFVGSGLGGIMRFSLSYYLGRMYPFFPMGTLVSNSIGMFLIGLLSVWFIDKNIVQSPYREMILIGFIGGLTTFSSFGYEAVFLFRENRLATLLLYLAGNLFLGFLLLVLGRTLGER